MREAYRLKGWAFNDPESIEQCSREGWSEKLKNQQKEGCRVYGYLEVNKVRKFQYSITTDIPLTYTGHTRLESEVFTV